MFSRAENCQRKVFGVVAREANLSATQLPSRYMWEILTLRSFAHRIAMFHLFLCVNGTCDEFGLKKPANKSRISVSTQRFNQLNLWAISIAIMNLIISASNAKEIPRWIAKHPLTNPLQFMKMPPQPKRLGAPLAEQ